MQHLSVNSTLACHMYKTVPDTEHMQNVNTQSSICVKLTDNKGAIDHGGSCRKFLQLYMECLSNKNSLFFGQKHSHNLMYVSNGMY